MLHYWFTIGRMLAPTLGSQKLVHRKPLERWTAFDVELELAGCDDRWIHRIHRFEQGGELRALGAVVAGHRATLRRRGASKAGGTGPALRGRSGRSSAAS